MRRKAHSRVEPGTPIRSFICGKCLNFGGTLINIGSKKEPYYIHPQGKCGELNYLVRNNLYIRRYPHLFWLPILNIGVDFDKSILNPE